MVDSLKVEAKKLNLFNNKKLLLHEKNNIYYFMLIENGYCSLVKHIILSLFVLMCRKETTITDSLTVCIYK